MTTATHSGRLHSTAPTATHESHDADVAERLHALIERAVAVQSTAKAMQNLWLAANAYGLGVSWMCAPLFCPEVVAATLGLPADFEPQALLTMGRPDGPVKGRARKPVEDVLWTPPQSEGT